MYLTQAELTILGLLIERPSHGYDLERVIEERGVRQWTEIGFSSIYYLLGKLEQRSLVRTEHADAGARSRRVFHATELGQAAARNQARQFISEAQPVAQAFLSAVANLPLLTHDEYLEALRSRLTQLDARIAAVRQSQKPGLARAATEVFSYSLALMDAERSWLVARVPESDG